MGLPRRPLGRNSAQNPGSDVPNGAMVAHLANKKCLGISLGSRPCSHTIGILAQGAVEIPAQGRRLWDSGRRQVSKESNTLTLDFAIDGVESTWDPINPVPRTWLYYRIIRRRAHHLPPDPNIFGPHTQNLKIGPFSKFGKILLFNE